MPRFYQNDALAVLYALDGMGGKERSLVERLFEAYLKHPRPGDCVPLEKRSARSRFTDDTWRSPRSKSVATDKARDEWYRVWWNPLEEEVLEFLRDNGHPFCNGVPVLWVEDVEEHEAEYAGVDAMFLVYDILVDIHDIIEISIRAADSPEFDPLDIVELTDEAAEQMYRGRVARGPVV
jgi:hypothetical protein